MFRDVLLLIALSPGLAEGLSCYICGDTNLGEFGECSTQFQYDCGSYAAKFGPADRIYCRTTRHRAKNNTFTVMKECISEQDHYRTFPEKGYQLDDECDLVDLQEEEVAYCLCRSDLCNKNSVAEQFMSFEEKHPELFGESEDSESKTQQPKGQAPLKLADPSLLASQMANVPPPPVFAAPMLIPPAIVPINDPRNIAANAATEAEVRRSQLPSRGVESDIGAPQPPPSRETVLLNLPQASQAKSSFVGSVATQVSPVVVSRPASPPGVASEKQGAKHCVQCGDSNLHSDSEDCRRQIQVECLHDQSMCFTRQIDLGNGMFAMEKMCVLPEQLVAEFGEKAREQGCGSSNGGRVQYCACTASSCNQISIAQQKQVYSTIEPVAGRRLPELAAPDLPQPMPPAFPTSEGLDQAVLRPDGISDRKVSPAVITAVAEPPPPPFNPPPPVAPPPMAGKSEASPPIVPVNHTVSISLRCAACIEADMTDPTADCRQLFPTECSVAEHFCLTKQTQITNTAFTMEKGCVSGEQLRQLMAEEKFTEGCATTKSGMVNFCVCKEPMCNTASLLQQAQLTGVRDTMQEQRELEEQARKEAERSRAILATTTTTQKSRPPPVFLDADDDAELVAGGGRDIAKDTRTEAEILRDRQREWARSDLGSGASTPSLLLLLAVFFFF
ncbi:unnamed protein product [Caenorhabditis auriculariae]|uniref:UPAR/Ly6 domain-containing protein n=1 Tax=Caenorhabditis auriculariae TaxID=2777116 RepID=A0A8S1HP51_9PELO|nr:unnamed protein product [Caenorhabditis auriculariae]